MQIINIKKEEQYFVNEKKYFEYNISLPPPADFGSNTYIETG